MSHCRKITASPASLRASSTRDRQRSSFSPATLIKSVITPMFRSQWALALLLTLCLGSAQLVFAQTPAPPTSEMGAGTGGVIIRPIWTEAAITVVMIGLTLFLICRRGSRS